MDAEKIIEASIRDWWNDCCRKVWNNDKDGFANPKQRDGLLRDLKIIVSHRIKPEYDLMNDLIEAAEKAMKFIREKHNIPDNESLNCPYFQKIENKIEALKKHCEKD